jgi:nitrogen fixation NifU-like protein
MGDSLDDFAKQLQDQIFDEARATYGEVAFERWLNPTFMGPIEAPDGHARVTGKCGDTMEIYLKFEGHRVTQASFKTDGCGSSVVCGSFAAEMCLGRDVEALMEITADTIMEKLGGLPEEDEHCAHLAAETVQEALHGYMSRRA